jgi:hypothetical protein
MAFLSLAQPVPDVGLVRATFDLDGDHTLSGLCRDLLGDADIRIGRGRNPGPFHG